MVRTAGRTAVTTVLTARATQRQENARAKWAGGGSSVIKVSTVRSRVTDYDLQEKSIIIISCI